MHGTPFRRQAFLPEAHDLNRSRARNDFKLKSSFERIFEKYNKDFTDIGDEIDLRTGHVVVDNGHLSGMRNERDTGSDPTQRFVRAFTEELGAEDQRALWRSRALGRQRSEVNSQHNQAFEHTMEVNGSEDELASSPSRPRLLPEEEQPDSISPGRASPLPSPDFQQPAMAQALLQSQTDVLPLAQSIVGGPANIRTNTTSRDTSGHALQQIDQNAVESLGLTIARQIATFLGEQLKAPIVPPVRPDPWAIPSFTPQRPQYGREYSFTPDPTYDTLRSHSPSGELSLWAPEQIFIKDTSEPEQPARKKQRIMASIETDAPVFDAPSRESSVQTVEQGRQASPVPGDFLQQARRNFNLLAHGIVNRGFFDDEDVEKVQEIGPVDEEFPITSRKGGKLKPFSRREDALIIRLRERETWGWTEISSLFPDRSIGSLQVRYSRTLRTSGPRSKRTELESLIDDEELLASVPNRYRGDLDCAVGSLPRPPRPKSEVPVKNARQSRKRDTKPAKANQRNEGSDLTTEKTARSAILSPLPSIASLENTDGPDANIDPELLALSQDSRSVEQAKLSKEHPYPTEVRFSATASAAAAIEGQKSGGMSLAATPPKVKRGRLPKTRKSLEPSHSPPNSTDVSRVNDASLEQNLEEQEHAMQRATDEQQSGGKRRRDDEASQPARTSKSGKVNPKSSSQTSRQAGTHPRKQVQKAKSHPESMGMQGSTMIETGRSSQRPGQHSLARRAPHHGLPDQDGALSSTGSSPSLRSMSPPLGAIQIDTLPTSALERSISPAPSDPPHSSLWRNRHRGKAIRTQTTTPINRGRQSASQVRASGRDKVIRTSMLRHSSGSRHNSSP